MSTLRSHVYLEGHHVLAPHLREYADALNAADFDVHSEWHDGGERYALLSEIVLVLARCDVLIVWLGGASNDTWLKVGWAIAAGLRIVFIGSSVPAGFDSIVAFRFNTWEDLAEDQFIRLGSSRFKKTVRK